MTEGGISKIEFNSNGFRQIVNSDGCQELVRDIAEDIAAKANANAGLDSFQARTAQASSRWIGLVSSTDKESYQAEAEDKALTGAIT